MTTRVKKVIEAMVESSPAELVERFSQPRAITNPISRVCHGADLMRLFESIAPDPGFADDIAAGGHERRAMAEPRVSPWER